MTTIKQRIASRLLLIALTLAIALAHRTQVYAQSLADNTLQPLAPKNVPLTGTFFTLRYTVFIFLVAASSSLTFMKQEKAGKNKR